MALARVRLEALVVLAVGEGAALDAARLEVGRGGEAPREVLVGRARDEERLHASAVSSVSASGAGGSTSAPSAMSGIGSPRRRASRAT